MATVPVEITWVTGQVVTAAQLNSNLRDAVNFLLSRPTAELRQTVAQSLTNNTLTVITFDTEDVDTDNAHSTSSNTSRYTAQTAGRYYVSGGVGFASNATGARQTAWALGGTKAGSMCQWAPPSGISADMPVRGMSFFMNVNDFIELAGLQASGGALNTAVTGGDQPCASIRWVGTT